MSKKVQPQQVWAVEHAPAVRWPVKLLMVSAALLCIWSTLVQRFEDCKHGSLWMLAKLWAVLLATAGAGQLAHLLSRLPRAQQNASRCMAALSLCCASAWHWCSLVLQFMPRDTVHSKACKSGCAGPELAAKSCRADKVQYTDLTRAATKQLQPQAAESTAAHDHEGVASMQKQPLQAEHAACLAQSSASMHTLLCALAEQPRPVLPDAVRLLHGVLEQAFGGAGVDAAVLARAGALEGVLGVIDNALQLLQRSGQGCTADGAQHAMPALLQATWLLLQAAHAGPHSLRVLAASSIASHLGGVLHILCDTTSPAQQSGHAASARGAVLRNVTWILLLLCDDCASADVPLGVTDSGIQTGGNAVSAAPACTLEMVRCLQPLQHLMAWPGGDGAGLFAAAVLSCLARGRSKGVPAQAAVAAEHAVLQPAALQGFCLLLAGAPSPARPAAAAAAHPQPGVSRAWEVVRALAHHLVAAQPLQLVRGLVEQRLMGCFLRVAPRLPARLLVCHVLSSRGQQVLCDIEEAYEVDVPLALVQVMLAPGVQLQLSHAPRQPATAEHGRAAGALPAAAYAASCVNSTASSSNGVALSGHVESDNVDTTLEQAAAPSSAGQHEVYTDVLAGRLLLQRQRLAELLHASSREAITSTGSSPKQQQAPTQQQQQQPASPHGLEHEQQQQQEASQATLSSVPGCIQQAIVGLVACLMAQDLQLQHQQRLHGVSLPSSTPNTSSTAGSKTGSSCASDECSIDDHHSAASLTMCRHAVLDGLAPASDRCSMHQIAQQQPQCSHSYKAVLPQHHAPGGPLPYHSPTCAYHSLVTADTCSPVCPECQASRSCSAAHDDNSCEGCSSSCRSGRTLLFGEQSLWLSTAQFVALCTASKLVRSVLGHANLRVPISLLRVPAFTDADNCWAVASLLEWLESGKGPLPPDLSQEQLGRLWVAADFLQVNGLQAACEDSLAASFGTTRSIHPIMRALGLCSSHPLCCARLLHLCTLAYMNLLTSQAEAAFPLLSNVRAPWHVMLLRALHEELRDRLVALCTINSSWEADLPEEVVD